MIDSYEKISVNVYDSSDEGAKVVAEEIAELIKSKQKKNENCVLGLATGSTPLKLYELLVEMHKNEGLSFKNVITFNLDEYYPLQKEAEQSYWHFMHVRLFNQVDILAENIHMPNGNWSKDRMKEYCEQYEQEIDKAGGIDLQILGIGNNGHIGFNEPGSSIYSRTRLVVLQNSTRVANVKDFTNIAEVPRMAITMGINTIMRSKKVILLGWGHKAPIIARAVEGNISEQVPASFLQQHQDCTFVVDQAGASELTRFKSPWLTGTVEWTPILIKKAVVNLALKLETALLNLTDKDYIENGLGDLLTEKGDAYEINLMVYYMLRDTITGWPGGKPGAEMPRHPERPSPFPKTCLIFSPHPDDDIISMGGTFSRLQDQGHNVHVAYQTSGNIAVTDEFVTRYLDFAVGFDELTGTDSTISNEILGDAQKYLADKTENQSDSPIIRQIKGLIRRTEAKATAKYVGLKDEQIHFLNLPFYETGLIEKKPMGEEDVEITMNLLKEIKPQQIYCAGDLADPHGTHRVCLEVVFESMRRLKAEGAEWIKDCWVWLYKGAWQEWDISEIEMAIPMSPGQVKHKRYGIFIHQSQKDMVPFQGSDSREFWQRAEERNAHTAHLYSDLGLTKYAAMEAFVRWHY